MSYVYAAACGPYVKIGCTGSIADRLRQLRKPYDRTVRPADLPDEPLQLLGYLQGDLYVEAAFHAAFAPEQAAGEWYHRTERIEAWASTLLHSLPDGIVGERHRAEIQELRDQVRWYQSQLEDAQERERAARGEPVPVPVDF